MARRRLRARVNRRTRPISQTRQFRGIRATDESSDNVHWAKCLDREEMVIASRKMRRADDHQSTHVAVRRNIAELGLTAGAEETVALDDRMTDAETRCGGFWEASREAHHHQLCREAGCCLVGRCALRWWWNEFEENIPEMTFVHSHREDAWQNRSILSALNPCRKNDSLTSCFIAHLPAYLHLGSKSHDGHADLVLDTPVDRVVYVIGIASGQCAEDDDDLA